MIFHKVGRFFIFFLFISNAVSAQNTPGYSIAAKDIFTLHSAHAMDSVFQKFEKQNPSNTEDNVKQLDNLRAYIAMSYAMEHNSQNAEKYIGTLQQGFAKSAHYFSLSRTFNQVNNLSLSEKYGRLAIDSSLTYIKKERLQGVEDGMQPASVLASAAILLSSVLDKEKRYQEAINILDIAMPKCSAKNATGLRLLKANLLAKDGKTQEALNLYADIRKNGNRTEDLTRQMKNIYLKIHGDNTENFDNYLAHLDSTNEQNFRDSVLHSSYHKKAPQFVLKNMEGKTISLKNYLGKVVVLDFWATWCVPCKASFPTMQQAINKYKNNPNIVFLFIDTWEYTDSPQQSVKSYINNHHYNFNVLFDLKNKKTKEYTTVQQYGITGVPAKYIIDRNGYIRFHLTGFDGSIESSLNELSTLIDIAGRDIKLDTTGR